MRETSNHHVHDDKQSCIWINTYIRTHTCLGCNTNKQYTQTNKLYTKKEEANAHANTHWKEQIHTCVVLGVLNTSVTTTCVSHQRRATSLSGDDDDDAVPPRLLPLLPFPLPGGTTMPVRDGVDAPEILFTAVGVLVNRLGKMLLSVALLESDGGAAAGDAPLFCCCAALPAALRCAAARALS